jgi:hypothetical protein
MGQRRTSDFGKKEEFNMRKGKPMNIQEQEEYL